LDGACFIFVVYATEAWCQVIFAKDGVMAMSVPLADSAWDAVSLLTSMHLQTSSAP
jgi:hypothetical protein